MSERVLAEIHAMFGAVPKVFQRMNTAGDLPDHWPKIRELFTHPAPLPREVVDTLLAALGLRCAHEHCFVLHSLALIDAGADRLAISELTKHLTVPSQVPDSARWSRIVRLAWLAEALGPQRRAAAHALGLACTPEEHARVLQTCAIGARLTSYVTRFEIELDGEPSLAAMPAELRALVPEFVQFHAKLREQDAQTRPVCTTCGSCERVRSTTDQAWYPREAASALLPQDVLFSHGICEPCVARYQ